MNRQERTRIGIITPDDAVNDDEYWQYANDDVTLLLDRYRTAQRFDPISPEMVASYGDLDLLTESAETLRITRPDSVVFFCNSCSFVKGAAADREICRRISQAAAAPASTVSTAEVEALRALQVKRVAVGAPYREEVTIALHRFLEQHGFEVVASKSLGLLAEWDIGNAAPSVWRELARDADHPSAECVLLACTGIRTSSVITALESELGKPLVSAPAAGVWHGLKLAGYRRTRTDRGVLFEKYL